MQKLIKNVNMELLNKNQSLNSGDHSQLNQMMGGDGSSQTQNITINNFMGVDSQTLEKMFGIESVEKIKEEFELKIEERDNKLKSYIDEKLAKIEELPTFAVDPSLLAFNKKLHYYAACSSSDLDIDMLSELLINRLKKRDNREDILAIEKAAEIVNYVKEEDLVALCVCTFMMYMQIDNISLEDGIDELMTLINKVKGACDFPNDRRWIENLGVLNAIRIVDSHGGVLDTYAACLRHLIKYPENKIATPRQIDELLSDNELFQKVKKLLKSLDKQALYVTPVGNCLINAFLRIRNPNFNDLQIPY